MTLTAVSPSWLPAAAVGDLSFQASSQGLRKQMLTPTTPIATWSVLSVATAFLRRGSESLGRAKTQWGALGAMAQTQCSGSGTALSALFVVGGWGDGE